MCKHRSGDEGGKQFIKLQMVRLLEKGEQSPSQISRDHYVTRSFRLLKNSLTKLINR
jgi:hypothetical protein